jgi:quercetin 2,3-dioxygenase
MPETTPALCPTAAAELPRRPAPYVQPAGTGRTHLLLGQVARTIIGAEETGGALSFTTMCGPKGAPIPLHYHDCELAGFLCTDGRVQGLDQRLKPNPDRRRHGLRDPRHRSTPTSSTATTLVLSARSPPRAGIGSSASPASLTRGPDSPRRIRPPAVRPVRRAESEFQMHFLSDHRYAPATFDAADDTLPGRRHRTSAVPARVPVTRCSAGIWPSA